MSKKKKEKFSDILTPEQKKNFRKFGQPDLKQNWLEIFTEDIISDLFTIMRSCSDNQRKADYVSKELADYGFYDVGLGTNILTMANPYYPGVVFKIALDDYGIADNFNDSVLCEYVPRYNRVFARDPSAVISVQERLVLPTQDQMDLFMPRILKLLKEMSKYFLIADLSPDMFLNYGVTRDGEFRFIDASDLYPLQQMKKTPRCNRITGEHKHTGEFKYCEGKLKYSDDFKYLICEKCGKQFLPLEFRPRKDVEKVSKILSDGYSVEERETMEHEELHAICQRTGNLLEARESKSLQEIVAESRTIFVGDDPEEDVEDEDELEENESEDGSEEEEIPEENELLETDSEDEDGPRTVYVNPDDEEEDEDERDNDGFMSLKPREVTLPMSSVTESPEAEIPAEVDDSGDIDMDEDETAANISNETSEIMEESSQETSIAEAPVNEEVSGIMSNIDPKDMEDTTAFVSLMGYLKKSADSNEQSMYKGFLAFMRKAMNTAVADHIKEQSEQQEEQADEAVPNFADMAAHYCKMLSESSNPADHAALQKIVSEYDVENDSDNKNNTEESDLIDPLVPHIHYHIVRDDGDEDSDVIPGIIMDIHGNFEEAYAESGLPIYISIDGGKTICLAVEAYKLQKMIEETVVDALVEAAMMQTSREDPQTSEESEESEDESVEE